ncbi:hypothetical protein BBBOND_0309200 [Babesia bigemina]|uniref:Uncharacterized protein n=1 Tax=Babesia bigemina TaxID=5866 RepID=A0A061DAK8_BABBI|nr:hypothetical protein BBBOND_0309200 [Babesia bigemina]CDR97017.1 hypothetical protein BBBOND_0309200 [Babesia bigemina]|eukprot:XP_012769203.1 hypothetical protein BBBOND_0309200 [Babesia bigemina]
MEVKEVPHVVRNYARTLPFVLLCSLGTSYFGLGKHIGLNGYRCHKHNVGTMLTDLRFPIPSVNW